MKSKIFSLSSIVAVLVVIIGGVYYFEVYVIGASSSKNYSSTNSVYNVLKSNNTFFALGESLVTQGNLSAAQQAYEKALPTASDQYQAGVVQFKLAIIQWTTDPIGSIPPLEAIATNPNYAYSTRAYALQYIAQAYDNPPVSLSTTQVQQLVSTTFNASPFSAMLVGGNTALAYRQIYDSADALYPLPLAEAMSAQWYGNQIAGAAASQMSSSTLAADVTAINADLYGLTGAIQTESSDPSLNIFTAEALEIKANVMRDLSIGAAGLGTTESDVAAAYKAALGAYGNVANIGTDDGFAHYNYATYLSSAYGASQATEVHDVLAPIYTNPGYAKSPLGFFLSGLAGTSSNFHNSAVLVASIDPSFRTYLLTLGWTPADFSS